MPAIVLHDNVKLDMQIVINERHGVKEIPCIGKTMST